MHEMMLQSQHRYVARDTRSEKRIKGRTTAHAYKNPTLILSIASTLQDL